ncbi:MAG: dimethylsulfoniopropionate demethylase [Ilumatobacter sp.]|nr:dimethylsulfoniopropionate demethylase [Ilumatobacter sp.]
MPAEIWVNNRVRSTPFTDRVEAAGVQAYSVYNHMLIPLSFRGLVDDYRHLKQHVQLWDVSVQRQVEVRGPDAAWLVQYMTPRDISAATVGRCLYTPLVDAAGGVVNDPVVLKLAEDRFWISVGDSDVVLWADGLATGLGLDVEVFEPDVSPLAVQGPKSEDLVARVFGEGVRDVKFFRFAEFDFQGRSLRVARTGWSKQGGFEIYLDDSSLGGALWDALWDAGEDLDVGAGCPNLIERIEGGLLSYGGDMSRANNPFECGFDAFIHLDRQIEFLARPALEAIAEEGPERRIMGLRIEADDLPFCPRGWPVVADGVRVGEVSSVAMSPDLGCGVAMGMMERSHWDAGTIVLVETPDSAHTASVCTVPFV